MRTSWRLWPIALVPAAQARLSDLLERKQEHQLNADETAELECLLRNVDQLTLLKTRARYTLNQAPAEVTAGHDDP